MNPEQTRRALARMASPVAPSPDRSAAAGSGAIVAGAVGRMGEALLNAVLARGGYSSVTVVVDEATDLSHARLSAQPWPSLPAAHDLFVLMAADDFTTSRSFHGRDSRFTRVDEQSGAVLAAAIATRGVRRVALISPAPMWEQFGHLHRGLGSPLEQALGRLDLERFVVLRPLRPARSPAGGLLQRFARGYLSLQMLMLPRSVPTLTSEQVARAALAVLQAGGAGVSVLSAAEIDQCLVARSASG